MREFELLQHVYARNAELQSAQTGGATVLIPPGDDMALVELRQRRVLVAADQVIEGRHYPLGTPPRAVGRKAVLRNLSDIAAMAGVPAACVATVALPARMSEAHALELFEGLRCTALEFGCPLVGGDTGIHAPNPTSPLVVSVTVLAEPGPTGRVVERRGAQAGDLLCVTGALGGSVAPDGSGRHLDFPPRIPQALLLVQTMGEALHAMIDISDGLGRDAAHLASAAGLDAEIDAAALPCTPGSTWRHALGDGEDYELAFACSGPPPRDLLGVPVTVVGRFNPQRPGEPGAHVWVNADGARVDGATLGWEHAT